MVSFSQTAIFTFNQALRCMILELRLNDKETLSEHVLI